MWDKIDGKTITSAGGVVLSLVLVGVLYKTSVASADRFVEALVAHNVAMDENYREDVKIKEKLVEALTANTAAINQLQTLIRTTPNYNYQRAPQ